MIFVSDHARSSKWWWIGAIRNTRLRKAWNDATWTSTESASITKIPPRITNRTSVFVITASPAIAPPSPSDPVSPMKIEAGKEVNHRKATAAPTRHDATSARANRGVGDVVAVDGGRAVPAPPAASPPGAPGG